VNSFSLLFSCMYAVSIFLLEISSQALGVEIHFGATVRDIIISGSKCSGVVLQSGEEIAASAVVLAVGHSARPLYQASIENAKVILYYMSYCAWRTI